MELEQHLKETREAAENIKGLPAGWGFIEIVLVARVAHPGDVSRFQYLDSAVSWISHGWGDRPGPLTEPQIEWNAISYYGKIPFSRKGRRGIAVVVKGTSPIRALRRLRQLIRKGYEKARSDGSRDRPKYFDK